MTSLMVPILGRRDRCCASSSKAKRPDGDGPDAEASNSKKKNKERGLKPNSCLDSV